ncbi:DUF5658 family protein [Paludisphaera borealis]|uniref:DUF5658 family protein n=1 Tax=Paludisphaera borealis TaxID=1387353 RepID=UPI0011AB370F|nr:DUF5658 family protein [Paludisphaera borealis]
METNAEPGDRRGGTRRQRPTGPLDAFRLGGRRARVRREEDKGDIYFLDRFPARTLALVVGVLGLTLLDGVLTIELLDTNSEEVNPLMRRLLEYGPLWFLLGKYVLTAVGLPFLVVFQDYRLFATGFRVRFLLPIFLSLYVVLVAYQLHLLDLGHLRADPGGP